MITARHLHMPLGATVIDTDDKVYTKIHPEWWDDGDSEHGNQVTNQWINSRLNSGAQHALIDLGLTTQTTAGWDVEEGDFVVITLDFLLRAHHENEHDLPFYVKGSSEQLWRVAGWTYHADDVSSLLLDGPANQMFMINRLQRESADIEPEMEGLEVDVHGDDTFQYVLPGQRHETWGWEWHNFYEFVEPRDL